MTTKTDFQGNIPAVDKNIKNFIIAIAVTGTLATVFQNYINGLKANTILDNASYWLYGCLLAIITNYSIIYGPFRLLFPSISVGFISRLDVIHRTIYPFYWLVKPFLILVDYNENIYLNWLLYTVEVGILYTILLNLNNLRIRINLSYNRPKQESGVVNEDDVSGPIYYDGFNQENITVTDKLPREAKYVLGQGISSFDNVISSILSRAYGSISLTNRSLYIMIVVVFIGVSLSIGTIALNQFSKVRELEVHRKRLLDISYSLFRANENVYDGNYLINLREDISKILISKYGSVDDYKEVLTKIDKDSSISWPDIAMRLAIAALTLFLAQILFNIYKYNQQQVSYLIAKAEIIELYKETEADKKDLRTGLLSKLDVSPSFGQGPTLPIEQVINIIDKAKGN